MTTLAVADVPAWIDNQAAQARPDQWWRRAAQEAHLQGRSWIIKQRRDRTQAYLLRFWLHAPRKSAEEGKWDSGDSLLLHAILTPDDDEHLHSHPWPFTSTVLEGGYTEEYRNEQSFEPVAWYRPTGNTQRRTLRDLHRVKSVQPDTWTLVQTGPRVHDWGFSVNGSIVPHADYFAVT